MKALAVFPSTREVRVVDHPEPKISSPTEVRMRVLDVGVCGTDRELVSFRYGTPPEGSDYLVIGHESLSEVIEVGQAVRNVKKGDLAVLSVRRPCLHPDCIACREGRQDFCYTGDYTERGIKQRHGFMTEFVVEDEQYLNVVPRGLREIAVLVEPLTIAEKSLEQLLNVQQRLPWMEPGRIPGRGHRAVVLGAGPVGLLGAMALRVFGFEVTVYSLSSDHSETNDVVDAIGGRYIAAETHSVEDMAKTVGRIDVVYEAAGVSSLAFEVIQRLGPNGIFIFTGVPGHDANHPVPTDQMMRDMVFNNQAIIGSVNAPPKAFHSAIEHLSVFMQEWPQAVRSLITARYPIERATEPLLSHPGGVKSVIQVAS